MGAPVTHNIGCPVCWKENIASPLMTYPGREGYFCKTNSNHNPSNIVEFSDSLYIKENAPKISNTVPRPPATVQPNQSELRVMIPNLLKMKLLQKFGDKLGASITAFLQAILDEGAYVVNSDTQQRISTHAGQDIRGPDKLVGAFYAMRQEIQALKDQVVDLRKTNEVGGIGIELPAAEIVAYAQKARAARKTVSEYLSEYLLQAIRNGWVV